MESEGAVVAETENVKIVLVKVGYAYLDKEGWMRANATCSLVKTKDNLVIVDTLTPWDGPFILQKLEELGYKPEDVTYVVSSHGHSDHNGNNNLFLNAKQHIVGYCVSNKDVYHAHPFEQDEPYIIDDFLSVVPTPGHTNEDVSLIVTLDHNNDDGSRIAVVGDLFECEQDVLNPELWTANSFNPDIQVKNRLKVLKMAKIIIPGHGKPFKVLPEHITAASELAMKYDRKST